MSLRGVLAAIGLSARRARVGLGWTTAVILAMASLAAVWIAIPLYAESASSRLLGEQVDASDPDRTPFGYLLSFTRLTAGSRTWADFGDLNRLLADEAGPFGNDTESIHRITESAPFEVFLSGEAVGADDAEFSLGRLAFTAVTDGDLSSVTVTSGRVASERPGLDGSVEAMVSDELAERFGVATGQRLSLVRSRDADPLDVVVVGTWQPPENVAASSRFVRSGTLRQSLLVPEATMASVVDRSEDGVFTSAQWLVLLDSGTMTTDRVDDLLARTDSVAREVNDALGGTRLLITPETALETYQSDVASLNDGLRLFSLPTLVLVGVTAMALILLRWSRHAREFTVLRQRGAAPTPFVVAGAMEALMLAAVATGLGYLGARFVALGMSRTDTFLRFTDELDLQIAGNARARRTAIIAFAVLSIVQIVPLLQLYGGRYIGGQRTAGRSKGPWWQRGNADLVVIGVIAVAAFLLLRDGPSSGRQLIDDPIAILLPAMLSLAVGLTLLRVLPPVFDRIADLVERTDATSALLVLRRAARVPTAVAAPLLLLVFTGSLSIYTASLARTLDVQLVDRAHHLVGGENSVDATSPSRPQSFAGFTLPPGRPGPPIDPAAFDRVWGVEDATRLATFTGRAGGVGGTALVPIELTGVDPVSFSRAAFWRDDYATRPLGELMGALRASRDGMLMQRTAMARAGLRLGDVVSVSATDGEYDVSLDMVIVGHFSQFPGWQPADDLSPAVVDLSDLEQRLGTTLTQRIVFSAGDGLIDDGQTRADLHRLGLSSSSVERADALASAAQLRPDRQGVFGLLTVGFLVAGALTVAGFVFTAIAGFRSQLTEFGILRASGMRLRSLRAVVVFELVLISVVGIVAAVGLGAFMSTTLLPRLVGTAAGSAPRLLPEVDWTSGASIIVALVIALAAAAAVLLSVLRRIRLFEAIKIGSDA